MKLEIYKQRSEEILRAMDELLTDLHEEMKQLDAQRTKRGARLPKENFTGYNKALLHLDRAKFEMLQTQVIAEDYPRSFPRD